jgi:uncharacterized membrane protein
VAPELFDRHEGLIPLLIAIPYLVLGVLQPRRPFATVAALGLGLAAVAQWDTLAEVWALLGLAHLWAALDHGQERDDGRWYAIGSYGAALIFLVGYHLPLRPDTEAAFLGPWALTLFVAVETAVAFALGLLRRDPLPSVPSLSAISWSAAGILLLFGVTGELMRAFALSNLDADTASLAGGLSVSVWWICFAAVCFLVGFRRQLRPLRLTGFLVAGLALLKVVFVDLSTLDALYRVGSAFVLGVASLGVAYAYHRQGGGDERTVE